MVHLSQTPYLGFF